MTQKPVDPTADIPLEVRIITRGPSVERSGGRPRMEFDVRQDDHLVEFYQDGRYLYTASSGEVFGHQYFMQILEDVINAVMLTREGRVEEANLIAERLTRPLHGYRKEMGEEGNAEEGNK